MSDFCPENERIKYKYFDWLLNAKQYSERTIEQVRKSLHQYEAFSGHKDFRDYSPDLAREFKKHLRNKKSKRTDENLSLSTINHLLTHVQSFFIWLSQQPSYRSRIALADIEYLNLTDNEKRAAKAPGYRSYPTVEQVIQTLNAMPQENDIDFRNRAMLSLLLLTAVRVDAMVSLQVKHLNIEKKLLIQNPREVRTKRRKLVVTPFYPVGVKALQLLSDYYVFLTKEKLFAPDDPLFPSTEIGHNEQHLLMPLGLSKNFWKSGMQASRIIKKAFVDAGLPAYSPHAFRHTLEMLGEKKCSTPEEFKAWSLGFGHEHVRTSFGYAHMSSNAQIKNIEKFWEDADNSTETSKESEILTEIRDLLLKQKT